MAHYYLRSHCPIGDAGIPGLCDANLRPASPQPTLMHHTSVLPPTHASHPSPMHFNGFVETTTDALRLIMAARQGIIPRITRRLNESERRSMITSGAVFVFSVEESGIKRWTEGLAWSPSRIVGNFLVYREVTERPPRGTEERLRRTRADSTKHNGSTGSFRVNGLIKKTITVKIGGSDHHLISYYRDEDVREGKLRRPTSYPDIMALAIPPEMVRGTNFRHPPHVEYGADGRAHIFDAEEAESRHQQARSPSSARSNRSHTLPTLNTDTHTSASSDTVSPSPSSPPWSAYEYDSGLYGRDHQVSPPSQSIYSGRWSGNSLPSSVDAVTGVDRSVSQFSRSSTSWQQPRAHDQTLPGVNTYASPSYCHYPQSPAQYPLTPPSAPIGPSAATVGAMLERSSSAAGWPATPPSHHSTPSIPPSRTFSESGVLTPSVSNSASPSPSYPPMDRSHHSQFPTLHSHSHRSPPRFGTENTSYTRVNSWAESKNQR